MTYECHQGENGKEKHR